MKLKLLLPIFALFFLSFAVTNNSYSEPRKVLLEYCTGTWCQWCPCGDNTAEQILQAYPNTMVLAYHGPASSSDPFRIFNGNNIIGLMGFSGYPTAVIDRGNSSSNFTYNQWYGAVQSRYSSSPNTALNVALVSKSYNTSTRELSVRVDVTATQNLTGVYMINYVLTEDNLIYPQTGNGSCPGSSNWVHNWVVRSMVNDALGDTLSSGTWNQNVTRTGSVTTTLNSAWVPANCKLNVFVYKPVEYYMYLSEVQQTLIQYVTQPLGVSNNNKEIPSDYSLSQNYPNPFNPATHVNFALPKDGNVSLKVYDMLGNEVESYVNGFLKAGSYNAEIDASNWASGVYFYKLVTSEFTATKKMMLVK